MADFQASKYSPKLKDLTGRQLGDWTVIEFAGMTSYGKVQWKCRCVCGKIKNVLANNLTTGKSTNCGCGKARGKIKDMTGLTFARLTVIRYVGLRNHHAFWECECSCGQVIAVAGDNLRNGNTSSCGCLNIDSIIERNTVHGLCNTKEYRVWMNMKQRCLNPARPDYPYYGGRGITIAPEWIESFETFLNDVGSCPDEEYTLDRIDNERGYEKGNTRWTSRLEQAHNRRTRRPRK